MEFRDDECHFREPLKQGTSAGMVMLRFYREPGLSGAAAGRKLRLLQQRCAHVRGLATELCFYAEASAPLSDADLRRLRWVLSPVFRPGCLGREPCLAETPSGGWLVEIGPRLNFSTAFSSNAVSICASVGIQHVTRLEVSTRYLVTWQEDSLTVSPAVKQQLVDVLHDRMTQCRYLVPLESFQLDVTPQPWYQVDVLGQGRKALEDANSHLGLAFDSWDLDYYTDLFRNKLKRNPTSVECFDLAQSNSEHSRHWFFKGKMIIDGTEEPESLIDMIIKTQETTNPNSIIKFSDNSSAIEGFVVPVFRPAAAGECSEFSVVEGKQHLVFTAETHNFPTGVAPFSGATTGTGGRLRDVHAVGRGGHYIAGTAGYCVGNLFIPGYDMPWEQPAPYPANFASPLEVLVEASNGASDYGNKFGEPVVCGFARSFGLADSSGERREWIKPIMFSGGVGCLDADMVDKMAPEKGMQVVKLGGPVYRIGVGGGAASSVEVQGDNRSELDFGAVQRGDAEMEQKLHRVIRACLELGPGNPICSIHDQGAGGNGNVLKEIVEPLGAVVFTRRFQLGDPTISTLELWGAEYQENDAILCRPGDVPLLRRICGRERCPVNFVGTVLDCGKIILSEEDDTDDKCYLDGSYVRKDIVHPVNLELELVLGKMPQKEFRLERRPVIVAPPALPRGLAVRAALDRVLRLPAVASKRYLTSKVDRCVTGLVAQQQCVGPLHAPLADVAVTALSVLSTEGVATAIGEQPIKGLIDPAAGARLTVAESLSNLVFAAISDLKDVKCSGNWMWAAKLPGEGAALRDACAAMCRLMAELGVAVDGGKDSLSMAARVGGEVVKAPGTLVVSTYAPCPDVTKVVTPDLKGPSLGVQGLLLHVDLSGGGSRLGGSALAQCFGQLGDRPPDVDRPRALRDAFVATQELIRGGRILAGHDVSDGGLVTCLLEMAFGGISGLRAAVSRGRAAPLEVLFSEEVGWVLEVHPRHADEVRAAFRAHGVPCSEIGRSVGYGLESLVTISVDGSEVLHEDLLSLYKTWEETSYRLECLQADPDCARQEFERLGDRRAPEYALTFTPEETHVPRLRAQRFMSEIPPLSNDLPELRPRIEEAIASITPDLLAKVWEELEFSRYCCWWGPPVKCEVAGGIAAAAARVAVVREEGSNGDREMAVALHLAGFEVLDVTMQDLLDSSVTVDQLQGVVFPGGFSYADVLGSAKGWAASLLFHPSLRAQFRAFAARPDTFSLGVCNGCQLMSLLGWVGVQGAEDPPGDDEVRIPDVALDRNLSGRFECRFATVRIEKSPAVMLEGMEGSVMGVWVAHGEGRFTYRNEEVRSQLQRKNCFAIKYVDDAGNPTEVYPLNPNGSVGGVAGVCSPDGRHLAMMPHPERCTKLWQWPWVPPAWRGGAPPASPWLRLFQNARAWVSRGRASS